MISPRLVSAIVVTRGDVGLKPIINSLAAFDEVVVWDNSREAEDVSVYGRYAALDRCHHDIVFVQDDDVILPPESVNAICAAYMPGSVTANMPARFRHDFYRDHCLVGFGAIFDRSAAKSAFKDFIAAHWPAIGPSLTSQWVLNTSDVVLTGMLPRILVDVPYRDREFASAPNRMWKQPQHVEERTRMLELVRKVAA